MKIQYKITGITISIFCALAIFKGSICMASKFESGREQLIQRQIVFLQKDISWLQAKINRRKALSWHIIPELYSSLDYKRKKLAALKNELGSQMSENQMMDESWMTPVHIEGKNGMQTTLPILFPSGKAKISKEYEPLLQKVSHWIKSKRYKEVLVQGFADTNPIHTPRYPSNFELGAKRAANVVHSLVKKGVPPSCFTISSPGKYRFPGQRPISDVHQMERYAIITCME